MMGNGKKLLLLFLLFAAVASVSAAIYMENLKPADLEEFAVQDAEARRLVRSYCEKGTGGDKMSAEIDGNRILYKYRYREPIDKDIMTQIQSQFDVYADSMEDAYRSIIEVLEEESGFKGITVILIFCDREGKELYRRVYV